jgi:uncharacterized membrane protein YjfL (UPF0719 family)
MRWAFVMWTVLCLLVSLRRFFVAIYTVEKMQRRLDERNARPDVVSENPTMAAPFSPSS